MAGNRKINSFFIEIYLSIIQLIPKNVFKFYAQFHSEYSFHPIPNAHQKTVQNRTERNSKHNKSDRTQHKIPEKCFSKQSINCSLIWTINGWEEGEEWWLSPKNQLNKINERIIWGTTHWNNRKVVRFSSATVTSHFNWAILQKGFPDYL